MKVWEPRQNPQSSLHQRFVGFFVFAHYTAFMQRPPNAGTARFDKVRHMSNVA